jgi:hypothetical protein
MRKTTMLVLCAALSVAAAAPAFAFDDKDKDDKSKGQTSGQVTVINTPAQPVPVTVTNAPSVSVSNTPTVTVVNTPTVTVGNTPTVMVGNTPGVTVMNTPSVTVANTAPIPIVALDATGAFQVQLQLNLSGALSLPVAIPPGKRLVVEYVTLEGSAAAAGDIQPIILFESWLNPSSPANFYIRPELSPLAMQQFYHSEQVRIYADALQVGVGYAGASPLVLSFGVSISGHLVSVP